MATATCSETLELDWQQLRLNQANLRRLHLFYQEPNLRPPVLEEMMPDIDRLIHGVATRFQDATCSALQYEELVGEGRLKLAMVLHKGHLEKQRSRANFFKFFKACLNNRARSLVLRHRFTEKRTGVKPPPKHERKLTISPTEAEIDFTSHKNVELSLDDEELNLQVADKHEAADSYLHAIEEYGSLLTPLEKLVYDQFVCPSDLTLAYASVDGCRKQARSCVNVNIRNDHRALGLGMPQEVFEQLVLSIKQKIKAHLAMSNTDKQNLARYHATVSQLRQLFDVQIPPTAETMLVRRLFTIAARDQFGKVNAEVAEMLTEIGAQVPRVMANKSLQCFGVLYQHGNRLCSACDMRERCQREAENAGLADVTISPRLLGARQQRVPMITPSTANAVDASFDDPEVMGYLTEHYATFRASGKAYYGLRGEAGEENKLLFEVESGARRRIRFHQPNLELQRKLERDGNGWYPPESVSPKETIELMESHVKGALCA